MRIINILGLTVFLRIFEQYRSILALMVFLNGFLYHSFHTNLYLKYYDIFFNLISVCFLAFFNFFTLFKFFFISMIVYFLNYYFFEHLRYYCRDISDLFHILGVQYVLSMGLLKILKKNIIH